MIRRWTPPPAGKVRAARIKGAERSNEVQRQKGVKVSLPRLTIQDMIDLVDMEEIAKTTNDMLVYGNGYMTLTPEGPKHIPYEDMQDEAAPIPEHVWNKLK